MAAKNNHVKTVVVLLKYGGGIGVDINNLLENCIFHKRFCVAKKLIKYGADIHLDDEYALRVAIANGIFKFVEFLLKNGATNSKDNKIVVAIGREDMIKLLDSYGISYEIGNLYTPIPFYWNKID